MADTDSLFAFPAATDTSGYDRTAPLASDLAQITNAFDAGAPALLALNIAQERGNAVARENELLQDHQTLSAFEFTSRYGDALAAQMATLGAGTAEYDRLMSGERRGWRRTGDNVNNIVTGLLGGIGDAATLATAVSPVGWAFPEAPRAVAEFTNDFREGMQGFQSRQQSNNRFLSGIRADLDEQDNRAQYERDRADGQEGLEASLSYIGRGFRNGATRLFEDGLTFETALGEGVGSLFAGGPISRATTGAANVLSRVGREFTRDTLQDISGAAAQAAGRSWGNAAGMPTAIGLMEGGSAYSGAMMEVLGMTHDELMQTSPQYRDLIASGMSQEDAQGQVANRAGMIAGAIVGPAAAATGSLVAGFEASPLAGRGMREIVENILKETTEEGIQSFTGQVGQNIGIQQTADENRMLVQGTGDALAEGAILGAAIGGVVQTPAMARNAVSAAGRAAVGALTNRANAMEQATLSEAGLAAPQIFASANEAVAGGEVQAAAQAVAEVATQEASRVREAEFDAGALTQRVEGTLQYAPEEYSKLGTGITENLAERGVEPSSRLSVLNGLAEIVEDPSVPPRDRGMAAMRLENEFRKNQTLFQEDLPSIMANLAEDSPVRQQMDALQSITSRMEATPTMQKARAAFDRMLEASNVNAAGPVTSESQQLAAQAAQARPTAVSVETATKALEADTRATNQEEGTQGGASLRLAPAERTALIGSKVLGEARETYAGAMDAVDRENSVDPDFVSKRSDVVADQIASQGGEKAHQLSLEQHVQKIADAQAVNDEPGIRRNLASLLNFAQHMSNKAGAYSKSLETGKAEPYRALGPNGFLPQKDWPKVTAHKGSLASMALGRRIHAEATAAAQVANEMNTRFSQKGLSNVKVPALNAGFAATTAELLRAKGLTPVSSETPASTISEDVRTPNRKETAFIREAFRDAMVLHGLPQTLLSKVSFQIKDMPLEIDPTRPAYAYSESTSDGIMISISHDMAAEIAEGKRVGDNKFMLMHEFGHGVDFYFRDFTSGAPHSRNKAFDKNGIVQNELTAMLDNNPALKRRFDAYVLGHMDNDGFTRKEVFAETFAMFMSNPVQFQTDMPQTFQIMDGIVDDVFGKNRNKAFNNEEVTDGQQTDTGLETATPVARSAQDVATSETVHVSEAQNESLLKRFPNLIATLSGTGRLVNWFAHAYVPKKDVTTRLADESSPLARLDKLLERPAEIVKLRGGKDVPYNFGSTEREAFQQVVEDMGTIKERMNERLQANLDAKDGRERRGLIEGRPIPRYVNGRIYNIVENRDGGMFYNDHLLDLALMASMNWAMNSHKTNFTASIEEVASVLGINEDMVTDEQMDFFRDGLGVDHAKERLGNEILSFWGLNINNKADMAYTRGIVEGLAAEIIETMNDSAADYLQVSTLDIEDAEAPRTFNRVLLNWDDRTKNLMADIGAAKTLIEDIVLVEPGVNRGWSAMENTAEVPRTQIRNPLVPLTRHQRNALARVNGVAYRTNEMLSDFMRGVGEELFVARFGADISASDAEAQTNVNHMRTLRGKALTASLSYRNVLGLVDEAAAHAQKAGIPLGSMDQFFSWGINRVNRPQMMGANNPQSDKFARQVFSPTGSVLNMDDPATATLFWKAIGQGLGLKTEKEFGENIQKTAMDMTMKRGGKYSAIITKIANWQTKRDAAVAKGKAAPNPQALFTEIADAMGGDLTHHALDSLMEVAKLRRAIKAGTQGAFQTFAYMEADGKTNGPINALVLLLGNTAGNFTEHWVDMVSKGGLLFGQSARTLNQHIQSGGKNANDLYKTSTDNLMPSLERFIQSVPVDVGQQLQKLLRVMAGLGMGISIQETEDGTQELVIDRGVAKNPLTVTIYGSGIDGIVSKLSNALSTAFYEEVTKALRGEDSMLSDEAFMSDARDILSDRAMTYFEDGGLVTKLRKGDAAHRNDVIGVDAKANSDMFQKFTFTKEMQENLRGNMKILFGNQLKEAIRETVMGEVESNTNLLRDATQAQSIFQVAMFQKKLMDLMFDKATDKEKYPNFRQGDFISQDELNTILKSINVFSPMVQSQFQNFVTAAQQRSDVFETVTITRNGQEAKVSVPQTLSRSLTGKLSSKVTVHGPALAGVRGIPNTVIGSGDGLMMQLLFSVIDSNYKAQGVFDGLNLSVDTILSGSRQVNEIVYKTWTENNPLMNLSKSFDGFMKNNPIETLDALLGDGAESTPLREAFLLEMGKLIEGKLKPTSTPGVEDIRIKLGHLQEDLQRAAQQAADRQAALKRVTLSVDQMAGGETPFHRSDADVVIPDGASPAEIMDALNGALATVQQEREANAVAQAKTAATLPRKARAAMKRVMEQFSLPLMGTGANGFLLNREVKAALKAEAENLPAETQGMMNKAVDYLSELGIRVVYGNKSQIDAYIQEIQPDQMKRKEPAYSGKYDPNMQTIFIRDFNPETFLHELVHAATFIKVSQYYLNPRELSQMDRDAIKRIEALRNEWVQTTLTPEYEIGDDMMFEANRNMLKSMNRGATAGDKAQSLNEFMAWSLSNQDLIQAQKEHTIQNPIARIVGRVLAAVKSLIWGDKQAPSIGPDMHSNLRFNTMILMETPSYVQEAFEFHRGVMLYQSPSFGSDARLTRLMDFFAQKEAEMRLTLDARELDKRPYDTQQQHADGIEIAESFVNQGDWNLTDQQQMAFASVVGALLSDLKLDGNALSGYQNIFEHVISNMTPETFMDDPESNDIAEQSRGQNRMNALLGTFMDRKDKMGRSALLSSFIAMATVSEEFRDILGKMDLPKPKNMRDGSIDGWLSNAGVHAMNSLARAASGIKKTDKTILAAVDSLSEHMTRATENAVSSMETKAESKIDLVDAYAQEQMANLSARGEAAGNRIGGAGGAVLSMLSRTLTDKGAAQNAEGIMSYLNTMTNLQDIRRFVGEIIGRTGSNAAFFDMITKSRSVVDQTRQHFVEKLPVFLKSKFSEEPSAQQMSSSLKGLARTDLASLYDVHGAEKALDMLTSGARRRAEISRVEGLIQKAETGRASTIMAKAKQLAEFMNTGVAGNGLLKNAYAIQSLAGVRGMAKPLDTSYSTSTALIDQLVTLYAVEGLPTETRDEVSSLLAQEPEAMRFMFDTLRGTRKDELSKLETPQSYMNHTKGYIRTKMETGQHLVLAGQADHARLRSMSYQKVGTYGGVSGDPTRQGMAYYYVPLSGKTRFNQGIAQTVQETVFGADPNTGLSSSMNIGGVISEPRLVAALAKRMGQMNGTKEALIPVWGPNNTVIAFERSMDPAQVARLKVNDDLADMLGVWQGRQVEELLAKEVNQELITRSEEDWKKAIKEQRAGEYVDISRSTDPVHVDAWKLLPRDLKAHIKEVYGNSGFPVRRDMIEDIIGTREASIGDIWTGTSRWPAAVREEMKKTIIGAFGNDAFRYLVQAERFIQDRVTDAKVIIVIKSMVVPAANLISNVFQLRMNGVPWSKIVRGLRSKTAELNDYTKRKEKEVTLSAELKAAEGRGSVRDIRKLEDQLQSIRDSYRRMSIWPLIEAGEFTSITDATVTREQIELANGRWSDYLDRMASKMPDSLKQVYRYGLITKDTPLFRAMATATQYGDFLGKAIMFDDMISKGMSQSDALAEVNEEFVNYNRYSSRTRSYADSIGLTWFWPFKLRSVKIAARTLRRHPTRALLSSFLVPDLPVVGTVGNPVEDNIIGAWWKGTLGYSMGWGMGLNAPSMIPWYNMTS